MGMPRPGLVPVSFRRWVPLLAVGMIAVLAGIVLPQSLPAPLPLAKAPAAPPAKNGLVYTPPEAPEEIDSRSMLTRLALGTAVVLGLCVATLWFGRRWMTVANSPMSPTAQLSLVETMALGNRCCLHLVHLGNRAVLVGVDGTGLKMIVPLPDSFEQNLSALQAEPHPLEADADPSVLAYPGSQSHASQRQHA